MEENKKLSRAGLHGKRVLFIAPDFFSYRRRIEDAFVRAGAKVIYFDERPPVGVVGKVLLRIDSRLIFWVASAYYRSIEKKIGSEKFDYLIVIKAESTPAWFVTSFRKMNPQAKALLYLWDSIRYTKNPLRVRDRFDATFSFDPIDCESYGFLYRPLFVDRPDGLEVSETEKDIDVSFVGTVHTDRLELLERIRQKCEDGGLSTRFFYYYPSRSVFRIQQMLRGRSRAPAPVSFVPLGYDELIDTMRRSRVVVDVNRPGQFGLTIRSIEALGHGSVLLTCNPGIESSLINPPLPHVFFDRGLRNFEVSHLVEAAKRNVRMERSFWDTYSVDSFVNDLVGA